MMNRRSPLFGYASLVLAPMILLAANRLHAQTIINVPPSPSPASAGADTIVNVLPGGTLQNFFQALNGSTLNIQGGTAFTVIGQNGSQTYMAAGQSSNLIANPGAYLSISGGRITGQVEAESVVDISGGRTNLLVDFGTTAQINISGGAIERIDVRNSPLTLEGVDFAIDGMPVAGLMDIGNLQTIQIPIDSVLTGVLADGRAFAHYHPQGYTEPFQVSLVRSVSPPPPSPSEIRVTNDSIVEWVGNGQAIIVETGGELGEHFRAGPGSRVEISSGRIQEAFHAVSAQVDLADGTIARRSKFFDNSVVNMLGGVLEDDAHFFHGSTLNVYDGQVAGAVIHQGATAHVYDGDHYRIGAESGGTVNMYGGEISYISADDGGTLNIYGGLIVDSLDTTGATVNIYGGAYSDIFSPRIDSELTLHATEIRHNGVLVGGLNNVGDMTTVGIAAGGIISGVFEDGTPFVLGGEEYDLPPMVKLVQTAAYTPGPAMFHVPTDPAPQGVHNGQTLIVADGGQLPLNFTAGPGSAVMIQGGTVGFNFEAAGATVDITDGDVSTIDAFAGTVVNISGNAEWSGMDVFDSAVANINGGTYNGLNFFRAEPGSTVNIAGGELRGAFEADSATVTVTGGDLKAISLSHFSSATISGGTFAAGIGVSSGSELIATGGTLQGITTSIGDSNLVGIATTRAVVDGAKVASLRASEHSVIEVRRGIIGDSDAVGGKLLFYGGALGDSHEWISGTAEMHGYDFQVNGVPIAGLDAEGNSILWDYVPGTTITGIFSDGTPFNIAPNDNFQSVFIQNGVLQLIRSAEPSLPTTITVPTDSAPYGASAGQTVILNDGGALDDNFLAGRGSTAEIHGGTVGDNFEAERSQVMISGGTVGRRMDVFDGAVVTIAGGSVGEELEIHAGGILNLQNGQIARLGRAVGGTLNMSGGTLGSGFQALDGSLVNVSGGMVASEFTVGFGATANISGGDFQSQLRADAGAEANISGGSLGVDARSGSMVSISGGIIDGGSIARSGSHVEGTGGSFGDSLSNSTGENFRLHGVGFEFDGVPVAGLNLQGDEATISVASGQLFTGTLADGTPFAFSSRELDGMNTVRLVRSADVPPGPAMIQVPTDAAPLGVHAGQQLQLLAGGSLPENFNAGRGSSVDILGGTVGRNLEAYMAIVNIAGGQVGSDLDAFDGSTVNVSGGSVGGNLDAYAGSEVNVAGGALTRVDALSGSEIHLDGGSIGELQATDGSHSTWTGGTMGSVRTSGIGTTLEIRGVDFHFLGSPFPLLQNQGDSLQLNLPAGQVLVGTLADGTPLVLGSQFNNTQIANGTMTIVQSALPGMLGPAFQQIVDANGPPAIGAGQTLVVEPGGALGSNFVAGPESRMFVHGGLVGSGFKLVGAELIVTGGSIGPNFTAMEGAEIVIGGGEFESGFALLAGAHALIRGGQLPELFRIEANSTVDLHGRSFLLNGQPIAGLSELGDEVVLRAREGQLLQVILGDGSTLEWRLTLPSAPRLPFGISNQALLRLQLVPEPASIVLFAQLIGLILLAPRRRGRRFRHC